MDTVTEDVEEGNTALFNKKLSRLSNKTRMQDGLYDLRQSSAPDLGYQLASNLVFPTLVQDAIDKAYKWGNDGKNGRTDPFTEIYDVILGGIH